MQIMGLNKFLKHLHISPFIYFLSWTLKIYKTLKAATNLYNSNLSVNPSYPCHLFHWGNDGPWAFLEGHPLPAGNCAVGNSLLGYPHFLMMRPHFHCSCHNHHIVPDCSCSHLLPKNGMCIVRLRKLHQEHTYILF